ncbi:MAG: MBL fold metallo-hydrolase [Eubacteriales bacterium]
MPLEFIPLFSGSSGNSIYIGNGRTSILIDAGVSAQNIKKALAAVGKDIRSLNAILVTHEHTDHIRSVGTLSRNYDLPVYANEGTYIAMQNKIGDIRTKNTCIIEESNLYINDLEVECFSVPHDAKDPVGYKVTYKGVSVACVTDLGKLSDDITKRVSRCQMVLLEANHDIEMLMSGRYPERLKKRILGRKGHLSNEDAGRAAVEFAKRDVRGIILGHLSIHNNKSEIAYEEVFSALNGAGVKEKDMILEVAARSGSKRVFVIEP